MISEDHIDVIAAWARETGPDENGIETLKSRLDQPLHLTFCFDDDITAKAKPVLEDPAFNLYLVGGGDDCSGCVSLTNDFNVASGVVVAEVEPEDD